MDDEDTFTSVTWENDDRDRPAVIEAESSPSSPTNANTHAAQAPSAGTYRPGGGLETGLGAAGVGSSSSAISRAAQDLEPPRWEGYLMVQVGEAKKELEGTKETFISYGIKAEVSHCAALLPVHYRAADHDP